MSAKTTRPARRIGETKAHRGFAAMDPAKQRAIAAAGGKAAHAGGQGHKWTSETARVAGRAGGLVSKRGPARKKQ